MTAITEHPAATYRRLGWATIRVEPVSKRPIGAWQGRIDEADAFQPAENIGIRVGEPSGGLVDVDLDCQEAVALAPSFLPPTWTFGRSGKPRSHWLYLCAGIKTRKPTRVPIELRSTGGQTVFPGSIHESGEPVEWYDIPGTEPLRVTEADLLAAFGRLSVSTLIARAWPGLGGAHHDAAMAAAGALWHSGWSLDDAVDVLLPAMELGGDTDLRDRETAIRDTWSSDRNRYGWPRVAEVFGALDGKALERAVELVETIPRGATTVAAAGAAGGVFPMSDLGNAERFAAEHGGELRHVVGLGWIRWNGSVWAPLEAEPIEIAGRSARAIQQQGVDLGNPALTRWGFSSESMSRIGAMLKAARVLEGIQTSPDDLDAHPFLLNCPNGTVDLRTGYMSPHNREHLLTKTTAVDYVPAAECPRFVQFLDEVFVGDHELAAFVMRYLGYSLTGSVREQVFQVWYGGGSNGKTTLIKAVLEAIGDYGQALASDLLLERRQARGSAEASPDVARLRGVRLAAGEETKPDQRWNESLIKQLTGGGKITARYLYKDLFEFEPTAKLLLAVNHKPTVRGTDHGIWRRIQLVPFCARFDGDKKDATLPDKLSAEAPGILALLVRSAVDWYTNGLQPPARVFDEVSQYREGQDVIGQFLAECTRRDASKSTPKSRLYQSYKLWAQQGGEYVYGKHAFNNALRERGFTEGRSGDAVWRCLELKSNSGPF